MSLQTLSSSFPLMRLVNAIIVSALKKAATEIVIRSDGSGSLVQYRVAGELYDELRPPEQLHAAGEALTARYEAQSIASSRCTW